jgi:hypothetical protein
MFPALILLQRLRLEVGASSIPLLCLRTDRSRISARIVDAEQAIVARARELFSTGNATIEEDQALDDALYALKALQNCLLLQQTAA